MPRSEVINRLTQFHSVFKEDLANFITKNDFNQVKNKLQNEVDSFKHLSSNMVQKIEKENQKINGWVE